MKNTYIFLRHAETVKDPSVHPKEWKLTEAGVKKIEDYVKKATSTSKTTLGDLFGDALKKN